MKYMIRELEAFSVIGQKVELTNFQRQNIQISTQSSKLSSSANAISSVGARPFQVGPVDKLKRNGFLYGILIISIAGGHFL